MQQGAIDAQTLPVPWDFRAKNLGLSILARAEELFTYPISGVVSHTKKIKDKPEEIKRLIKAGIRANRYMRTHREATIDTLAPTYKLDRETAAALYDSFVKGFNDDGSLPEDGLRQLVADTKTIMKIDREIALSEVMELSILRSAQRELGIK
jgi:ABC-type nitrate/sulfonate/bicarbonate transport system substrate-binding protein